MEDIQHTTKVMGGEDWERWMKALSDPGARVDTVKAILAARKGKHLYGVPAGAR